MTTVPLDTFTITSKEVFGDPCVDCMASLPFADSRLMEDMDISPGSTPTYSPRGSRQHSRSHSGGGGGSAGHGGSSHHPPHSMVSSTASTSYANSAVSASSASSVYTTSGATTTSKPPGFKSLPQLISQLGDKTLQRIDSQELTQQGKSDCLYKTVYIQSNIIIRRCRI